MFTNSVVAEIQCYSSILPPVVVFFPPRAIHHAFADCEHEQYMCHLVGAFIQSSSYSTQCHERLCAAFISWQAAITLSEMTGLFALLLSASIHRAMLNCSWFLNFEMSHLLHSCSKVPSQSQIAITFIYSTVNR